MAIAPARAIRSGKPPTTAAGWSRWLTDAFEVTVPSVSFRLPVGAWLDERFQSLVRRFEFTGVATDWASDGAHLSWDGSQPRRRGGRRRTSLDGTVDHPVASVAAADGRVYVGTDGGRIVAFDGESGESGGRSRFRSPPTRIEELTSDSRCGTRQPRCRRGDQRGAQLDVYAPDGSVLWDQPLQRSLNGRPHVRGDTVYARSEFLRAFNRDSGAPRG